MNRFLSLGVLSLVTLLFMSCGSVKEPPEFRDVSNVQIGALGGKDVDVSADVVLYNPNAYSYDIAKVVLEISNNGNVIAQIDQEVNKKLVSKEEVSIPVKTKVKVADFIKGDGLLGMLGSVLMKNVVFDFKGKVTVKAAGIPIPVDIEDQAKVKLN